ncbi:MAG: type II toxin-antitoxin system RelE/ParE family toxin [Thermodesulfobacteriota bacterium]|nr:type II toxin-antitoxin system RelE/ParE family toxin [Thermodesulfobacteriota bacterium]
MKPVIFKFTAQKDIKSFPENARQKAGHELMAVQMGESPIDWKPMPAIGAGVKEIRIHENGEFRVVFIAKFPEAVYVLHAFQKKSQKTPKNDITLAQQRLKQLGQERRSTS